MLDFLINVQLPFHFWKYNELPLLQVVLNQS